jgi:hypothetical protein
MDGCGVSCSWEPVHYTVCPPGLRLLQFSVETDLTVLRTAVHCDLQAPTIVFASRCSAVLFTCRVLLLYY